MNCDPPEGNPGGFCFVGVRLGERVPGPGQRARFLGALARCAHVAGAAEEAGVSREAVLRLRERDGAFRAAWDAALHVAVEALEAEARRRAVEGVESFVVNKDGVVHHDGEPLRVRRYSDALLMALLRAHRPEAYRDRVVQEHSGPGGGPIPVMAVDRPPAETREDWIERRRREIGEGGSMGAAARSAD